VPTLYVDHVEARRRLADREEEVAFAHGEFAPQCLLVGGIRNDDLSPNGDPPAVVVVEFLCQPARRGIVIVDATYTRLVPVRWYWRMPSAARYESAPTVPVGLNPAF